MEHKKKALPFLWAFLISIVVTLLIAILNHVVLKDNPLLLQLAILASLFAVCLTGILTRSKLKGLANIFVAPVAWGPSLAGIDSPWGLFTNLESLVNDLLSVLKRTSPGEDISEIESYVAYIKYVDLIIILFLALFFGFFCSMISTGFFHKDGSFATITIFSKLFALIMLLILIPVPIAYHGVAKTGESVVALAAGALVVSDAAGEMGEANVDNIDKITKDFEEAQDFFDISRKAFDHVQANFLFMIIMNQLGTTEIQDGVPITDYVDIADSMLNGIYYLAGAAPNLYGGIASLMDGMNDSFAGMEMETGGSSATMTSQSVDSVAQNSGMNPVLFAQGIALLQQAMSNFTAAETDLAKAWNEVEKIFRTTAFQKMTEGGEEETADTLRALESIEDLLTFHIATQMGNGTIYFLKATFAVLSAVEDLGNNRFIDARNHLVHASANFSVASSVFGHVLDDFPPELADSELTQPIWGGVMALTNMTTLITHFTNAAINGTDGIIAVNNTANIMANMNLTEALENPDLEDWDNAGNNLGWATANLTAAGVNIGNAAETSADISEENYGDALNDPMHDFATELVKQLGADNTTGFWGNVTDFGYMLRALTNTYNSMKDYTLGFNYFDQALVEFQGNTPGNTTGYYANLTLSSYRLGLSKENASDGVLIFEDFFPEMASPGKDNIHMDTNTEDMVANASKQIHTASSLSKLLVDAIAADDGNATSILGSMNGNVSLVVLAQGFLNAMFGGNSSGGLAVSMSGSSLDLREERHQTSSKENSKTTINPKLLELKRQLEASKAIFVPFFLGLATFAIFARLKRKR